MTNRQKTSIANRVLNLTDRARSLYQRKDDLFQQLLNNCAAGTVIETRQGRFEIIDNFAAKNVGYRPASFHRYELKEVKAVKPTKAAKESSRKEAQKTPAIVAAAPAAAPMMTAPAIGARAVTASVPSPLMATAPVAAASMESEVAV